MSYLLHTRPPSHSNSNLSLSLSHQKKKKKKKKVQKPIELLLRGGFRSHGAYARPQSESSRDRVIGSPSIDPIFPLVRAMRFSRSDCSPVHLMDTIYIEMPGSIRNVVVELLTPPHQPLCFSYLYPSPVFCLRVRQGGGRLRSPGPRPYNRYPV